MNSENTEKSARPRSSIGRLIGIIFLLAFVGIAAAACTAEDEGSPTTTGATGTTDVEVPDTTAAPTPTDGGAQGEIVIGISSDPAMLDPQLHADRQAAIVEWHIFDSLINKDRNNEPTAGLAVSWEAIDDTTWEFKLREGVEFHNGEPFNADAVKYSYDRIREPERNAPLGFYFGPVTEVEVVDDFTVRIYTDEPLSVFPLNLSTRGHIVPPGYIEDVGDEEFANNPVGTGPYRFVEWSKDDRLVLEANPDYWAGPPNVERVVFRTLPEASTRLNELRTGGIDVNLALLPDQVPLLDGEEELEVISSPILRFTYILMDWSEGPLADIRVRQAINYAINTEEYISALYGGEAFRVPAFVNPLVFGFDPEVEGYPYDPDQARELLAEAGYPDGFSIQLNGEERLLLAADLAQAIAEDLRAVGIDVELNSLADRGVTTDMIRSGDHGPMFIYSWGYGNVFDADNLLYPNFSCGQIYPLACDEELDRLLDEERRTFDANARAEILSEIQQLLVDETYGASLLGANVAVAFNKRVDWTPTGDESINVYRDVSLLD